MNNVEGWVSEISLVSTLGKEHYLMDIKHEVYHTKVYKEKIIYRIAMMSIHDYKVKAWYLIHVTMEKKPPTIILTL